MGDQPTEIDPGTVIDLTGEVIGLRRDDGTACLMPSMGGGPPERLDGHTIALGAVSAESLPPHAGECHPDVDEILILVSGQISVHLELPDGDVTVEVGAGESLVVPQGVWHLIDVIEPGQLVNITPGPHGDYRPLASSD